MRRVIISDLHMGAGDRLDDFDADAELSTFIRTYVTGAEPTELILAGDTDQTVDVVWPDLDDADASEQLWIFTHGLMIRQILQPDPKSQAHCRKLLEQHFKRLETATPAKSRNGKLNDSEDLPRRRSKAA